MATVKVRLSLSLREWASHWPLREIISSRTALEYSIQTHYCTTMTAPSIQRHMYYGTYTLNGIVRAVGAADALASNDNIRRLAPW